MEHGSDLGSPLCDILDERHRRSQVVVHRRTCFHGPNIPAPGRKFSTEARHTERAPAPGQKRWCYLPDGRDHGPYRELYRDGNVLEAGQFRDGEFYGTWTRWSPEGDLLAYEVFEENESVRREECRKR